MEATVEKHILQQKLENANAEFLRYCNTLEKKVVDAMKEGYSWEQLISHVGPTQSGKLLTLQEARHIRNVLEYRMVCWYSIKKIFDVDYILKGLNLHSNLNKRFFREEKLSKLPYFPTMQAVAKGNTKRPEKYEHKVPKHSYDEVWRRARELFGEGTCVNPTDGEWSFCSKVDERGKKHDHYVLYINDSGYAYSHVSKMSWNIFDGNERPEPTVSEFQKLVVEGAA